MNTKKYTTTKLSVLTTAVLLAFTMKAHAGQVEVKVEVYPVGDFTAVFKDIDGFAYADGDGFKADAFSIPWKKVDTGMTVRDGHTQKYFHADKYPNIEVLQALGKGGKGVAKITMNGSKPKIVKGTYTKSGNNIVAEFPVTLSEFDVKGINFKGAGVQDKVNVKVTVPIKAKK